MYSSISTLVVILTTLLTQSFCAQLNSTNPSTKVLTTARPSSNSTLSKRGDELFEGGGSLGYLRGNAGNYFDPNTNPNGLVNLGTAENYLAVNDVAEFVNKNFSLEPKDFTYREGPSGGTARLRKAIAKFLNLRFDPRNEVNPDQLLVANGVTGILNTLGLTLGDPGDGFLFGRPIYGNFRGDFGTIGKIQSIFVDFDGVDQFSPEAVAKYETALIEAEKKGIRIRALVLCNPHNPLGQSYPKETIIGLLKLSNKYKIHLLSDEIYALSIYDNEASAPNPVPFQSVLSLDVEKYLDPKYLQFIYGLSKDTAASGLRLGVLYTRNAELLQAVGALASFQWSGNANERAGIRILEDEKWLDGFFRRSRARLTSSYQLATKILESEGIQYHRGSNAGFFLWVDLRPYLDGVSVGEKTNTTIEARWEAEEELGKRFSANNVSINAGRGYASPEPGWFRVIFSQEEKTIREGLRRVFEVLKGEKK